MTTIKYICPGRLGNILFGVSNLLSLYDRVELLGNTNEDNIKILKLIFGESIIFSKNYDYNDVQYEAIGNPHIEIPKIHSDKICGYFQIMPDEIIINKCKERLKPHIKENNYIVVHVRRGDFLSPQNSQKHATMCSNFYKKAMSYFDENTKFIVISDDIEWCKNNIYSKNIEYSTGTIYDDFMLMLGAKGVIYGNSTFSYWGALLNPKKDKVIVANKYWYKAFYKSWNDSYEKIYPKRYLVKLLNYLYI